MPLPAIVECASTDPDRCALLQYLGIPLVAGIITRAIGLWSLGKRRFEAYFLPYFGPLALIGLLYTYVPVAGPDSVACCC